MIIPYEERTNKKQKNAAEKNGLVVLKVLLESLFSGFTFHQRSGTFPSKLNTVVSKAVRAML